MATARRPDASKPGHEKGSAPRRTCVVTRRENERARMLRCVVGPDGVVVPDLAANLPGRGIWLSARADVLSHRKLASALARAAERQVRLPEDFADRIAEGLRRRLIDRIGFARRAGQAVAGFQKAQAWLAAGRASLLVQASDGSAEERARLVGRHRHLPVIDLLPGAALGTVFGRDFVVHVAIAAGGLADSLEVEAARLAGVIGKDAVFDDVGSAAGADAPDRGKDLDAR